MQRQNRQRERERESALNNLHDINKIQMVLSLCTYWDILLVNLLVNAFTAAITFTTNTRKLNDDNDNGQKQRT